MFILKKKVKLFLEIAIICHYYKYQIILKIFRIVVKKKKVNKLVQNWKQLYFFYYILDQCFPISFSAEPLRYSKNDRGPLIKIKSKKQ